MITDHPHDEHEPPVPGAVAASSSGVEQRASPRFALLLRVAKLVVDEHEYLCILRDASNTGVKIRLFHVLPPGTNYAIDLGNGDRYPADVMWCRDDHAGLCFKREIDVRRLLDDNIGGHPKRPIRLTLDHPVLLTAHARSRGGVLRNISQQGACIEHADGLRLHETVRIECRGLPTITGSVRWRRAHQHGLALDRAFELAELAQKVARLHRRQSQKSFPTTALQRFV